MYHVMVGEEESKVPMCMTGFEPLLLRTPVCRRVLKKLEKIA